MRKALSCNPHSLRFLLTTAFTILTFSTIYLIPQVPPYIFLRYFFASIFCLFLTGYTFVQLLFPKEFSLDPATRVALSFGTSLALIPLVGLILNITPYGLGRDSSFAVLTFLTISFAVGALARSRSPAANNVNSSKLMCKKNGLKFREWIFLASPFILAACLRLYPFTVSGMPFSTDGWPFIKNCEILIERSPINLGDNAVFDGAGNYWPAISLFGAVMSPLTSLSSMEAMALFLPITGALAILIFYTLARNLFNNQIALIASIIFGTAFTHAYFTAGVTKETYANPLYFTLLLIFLNKKLAGRKTTILAFTIVSIALALTHHLTSVITITILTAITIAQLISNIKNGKPSNKFEIQLTLILTATFTLYFALYAHRGFVMPTISEILSAASYQIVMFALAAYITFKPHTPTKNRTIVSTFATAAAAILLMVIATNVTLLPDFTTTVQRHILPYIIPYFIIMPFITLGHSYQKQTKKSIAPLFWLSVLIGLQAYALFGGNSPLNTALWIRNPNFLYPPIAIFAAAGLHHTYKIKTKPALQKLNKLIVVATILTIIIINVYSFYAAVHLEDKYLGYHWLYRIQEYKAGAWITAKANSTITGDMKVSYLMNGYYRLNVDVLQGYKYLTENTQPTPQLLFTYDQMLKNGYVLGFHGVDLPQNWTEKTYQLNHIYSNGPVNLYTG